MGEDHLILYVDDEWSNRVVFEQSFGSRFRVVSAGSGAEALEILKRESIALLVTDQRMPGMSGNELLEHAKALYPNVIRIVLTAFGDLDPILRAVNVGLVARYLLKPWDRAELGEILTWGLEAFAMGREQSEIQLRLLKTERLATIGSLTATVFHDLDNVLSHCKNNTQRLDELSKASAALTEFLSTAGGTLRPEDRRRLSDLAEELPSLAADLTHASTLMEELSGSVRKLLRKTPAAPRDDVEPKTVIDFVLTLHRGGSRGTQVVYDGPPSLPRVRIGMTELSQVLLNLLANALQAIGTRESGGRVTLAPREDGAFLRIVVSDDGPGMTPEVRAKAGTPFYSTREEGTGLGLANCRRLVERVGGTLTIESDPGSGTTVSVRVPRVTSP